MGDEKNKEEKKVPVFTVVKKDSILKNIYLDSRTSEEEDDEDEQVIVIGRHPDCSITLDHPSISRFHLRLHSNPSSLNLSLVDLSSVHGTWVSGKKVQPGVQVDLNEGDIVQLGGSSRLYVLHWVSMSRAYDLDVPFVPPMNVLMNVKQKEELSNQDENCCSSIETNQIQSQCTSVGDLDLSISKKESTVSSSSPTMPEFGDSTYNEEEKEGNLYSEECKQNEISGISAGQRLKEELIEEIKDQHSDEENEIAGISAGQRLKEELIEEIKDQHSDEENEIAGISAGQRLKEELIEEIKDQHSDEENEIAGISAGQRLKEELIEEIKDQHSDEENEIAGISAGQHLKEELIEEIKDQHSDEDSENLPIASSLSNDHNKDLCREEHKEHEISGLSCGTLLKESAVTKFKKQQSDEEHEENEISGFYSGTPLKESAVTNLENQQSDKELDENEISGFSSGTPSEESDVTKFENQQSDEEHEENDISGFSFETPLKESAVTKFENQQSDEENDESPQALVELLNGTSYERSPNGDHNKNLLRKADEENKVSAFSSGQRMQNEQVKMSTSGCYSPCSSTILEKKDQLYPYEENDISGFSFETPLKESAVTKFENQQSDEENDESPQALVGLLNGTSYERSPNGDHNKNLLRKADEENEVSAFSSGQRLQNEQVKMSTSGCYSPCSSTILEKKDQLLYPYEENDIDGFSFETPLKESAVAKFENQQSDEENDESPQALVELLNGTSYERSPNGDHNKNLLRKADEENEVSAFSSGQRMQNEQVKMSTSGCYSPCSSTILEKKDQLLYPYEENDIDGFSFETPLKESAVTKFENQQSDEENDESPQALVELLNGTSYERSPNGDHNKNLLRKADEENEVSAFSSGQRMQNEQVKMSTSGCYSPCSSTILEKKDQLYPYEQDHNVQYSLSSGIHEIPLSKNTPSKSEQENDWTEITRHSLSDVCSVVGESSEALDKESSLKGDNKQKEIPVITGGPKMDLINLSICCESIPTEDCFEQLDENINTKETFSTNVSEPKDTDINTPLRPGQQSGSPRSIRVKPTSIDIQTGKWFPTNTEVKELYKDDVDYESVSEALISNVEVFAEEIFTPDKENFTPDTLKHRSTKKTNILEEIKLLDPLCLSPPTNNSICWNFVQNEELTFSSDKENHTPKVLQKSRIVQAASKNLARLNVEPATKNKISRIPSKSLLSNSSGKSCRNDTTIGSSNPGKYAQLIEKNAVGDNKRWIMVADTNCLLNKVSRKALQLLQGIKGTRLIIPRVVIRELDCMKRRGYLFTRTTEISSALQWIEDCMINTNWWIHVESLEEGRHFTPAPSLSTSVGEIEDLAFSSSSFSAFLNFLEIVSPTPGDHILLECALLNRKLKNDENLIILSDDVSLKIKAMAEGIICEAAEEFRESLVNPFSDRFLWAKSSPRGLTWSCEDDIVLREKYYRGPFKKPASKSGESLKGLKLILVQNSYLSGLIPNSLE